MAASGPIVNESTVRARILAREAGGGLIETVSGHPQRRTCAAIPNLRVLPPLADGAAAVRQSGPDSVPW